MRLEAFQRLGGDTVVEDIATCIVRDAHGNPLIVACELTPGFYEVSKLGDPDFEIVLRTLGVNKTAIVKTVSGPRPKSGERPLGVR